VITKEKLEQAYEVVDIETVSVNYALYAYEATHQAAFAAKTELQRARNKLEAAKLKVRTLASILLTEETNHAT
jgi:hypothetical protein